MRALPTLGDFDTIQRDVIEAPVGRRALVVAGPGTGKTAVACGRLAHLVATGTPASGVLMISFTRTAVVELRNRIRAASGEGVSAAGVRIVTLDSEAWRLRHGFTEEEVLRFGGYDANIDAVVRLLRTPSDEMRDYFATFRHVVVDEAQDLTEQRALLVLRILGLLEEHCGFTVFGDGAQAIYGFTSTEDGVSGPPKSAANLLERIESRWSNRVARTSLSRVYRAATPATMAVFGSARDLVLREGISGPERHQAVLDLLHRTAPRPSKELEDEVTYGDVDEASDVLWLFRQRREVLHASGELARTGRPHRLRLAHLPIWLEPWLAGVLSDLQDPFLTLSAFEGRAARLGPTDDRANEWWKNLLDVAGRRDGSIDVARLRRALLQARQDHILARSEFGAGSGPTLGTIHASKGREARRVLLDLPADGSVRDEANEEARVAYVGATRALEELYVRLSTQRPSRRTERSGRVYSPGQKSARVEFGMADDLALTSPVARTLHASAREAEAVQEWLSTLDVRPRELGIVAERVGEVWRNVLVTLEGPLLRLGVLASGVVGDLFEIGRAIGIARPKLPQVIADIHLHGARTVVLSTDVQRTDVHEPWATSGVFLAPVIHGFPRVAYNLHPGAKHAR